MAITIGSYIKRGYIPLAVNRYAGIAWQGEPLHEFWMWNRQFVEDSAGLRMIQTVRVNDVKEAAVRYFRDGWVPIKRIDDTLLRRMEAALRKCGAVKGEMYSGEFLKMPEPLPEEFLSPALKKMAGGQR
ncbi:MAG: hypothetical protein HYV24_04570 [Deltaproteobacteria bacterium]|nr:hypothetical protein [Deltaproteobacteria bacterium]